MGTLSGLLLAGVALIAAARMWRSRRAFGPARTLALFAGCLVVTLCATAALWLGMRHAGELPGLVAFVLVFMGGLALLIAATNRRWPPG